ERASSDEDLQRVRQRVQQRGPSVDEGALFGLTLDAEGQRRALEDGSEPAAAESHRVRGNVLERQEVGCRASRWPSRESNHDVTPVTRTRGCSAYASPIASQSRKPRSPIRSTPSARPVSAGN